MHKQCFFIALITIIILTACQSNELTPEQIVRLDAADNRISSLLFEQKQVFEKF